MKKSKIISNLKTIIATSLVWMLLFTGAAAVLANTTLVEGIRGGISIRLNGTNLDLAEEFQPVIIEGRTFISVSPLATALGLNVDWDDATRTVILEAGSGQRTAADYLAAHSQADLDAAAAAVRAMGMELEITTDGNVLVYTYTFLEQIDGNLFSISSEMEEMLRSTAEGVVLPEMRDFGVSNPGVRYVYLNADGSLLGGIEF